MTRTAIGELQDIATRLRDLARDCGPENMELYKLADDCEALAVHVERCDAIASSASKAF